MGARLEEEREESYGGARETHGERQQREDFRSAEQPESPEQSHEGQKKEPGGREAFGAGGDPEVPHARPSPLEEHVRGHRRSREELDACVKQRSQDLTLGQRHGEEEGREDA